MADTKGIVITFKGDTIEFDRSVDGVNKALKTLKTEMGQINKQLKLDPTNVELLKNKFKNLQEQQKVAKEQVKLLKDEIAKLDKSEIGGKQWLKYQKELSNAESELQKLNKEVEKFNNTNFNLVAMGNGLTDASKKTQKLANDLKGLSAVGIGVAASLGAITLKAGANADEINTLAKQYNLTTDQIQQFQLASDLIDVDLNTILRSYSKLTKNMTSSSKDVQGAFETLGVATKDANGELRSSNDVFNELISALSKVENETEQDNLAMQVFGKSAAELGSLINGGSEQLAQFSQYLEENSLILSNDELDSLNSMNDAIDTIKATLSAFANKIATTYAPYIQKAFEKINEVIIKIKDVWDQLSPSVQLAIPIISGVVGALAPALTIFSKLQGALGGLLKTIGMGGNGGLSGALKFLTSPIGIVIGLFALFYTTNEEFRNSINQLVGTLVESLKPILDQLFAILDLLFKELMNFLMPIITEIGNFLAQYIIPAVSELASAILPVLSKVLEVVFGFVQKLVEWIKKIWQFLEDLGVIDAFRQAFEKVGETIQRVVGWVKDLFSWFGNLIEKAKEFLGINGKVQATNTNRYLNNGRGYAVDYTSGGYGEMASGGFVLNNTINISNNGASITQRDVINWADVMTNRINENLGRLM